MDSPKELTWKDRLILNNIFDTQPQKRAGYLRQLGFEMDPKDDNRFRALGSKGGYVGKIDPSPMDMGTVYAKGGVAGILKEHALDAGDMMMDFALPAAGAAAGMQGGPLVALLGGIAARATGYAAQESLKNTAADLLLEESIPYDLKLGALQALMAGVTPAAGKSLVGIKDSLKASNLRAVKDSIVSASQRFSGGKLTPQILHEAAKNPGMFTKEAVQGAEKAIGTQYQGIFGIKPPSINSDEVPSFVARRVKDINAQSEFGKALTPLNQAADAEMKKLTAHPQGRFRLAEVMQPFQNVRSKIESTGVATPAQEAGLAVVDRYQKQALKMAQKNGDGTLTFEQVRNLSKSMKDAAFDDKVHGAELLAQVAGSGEGQLGTMLTAKADSLGSNWKQIQQDRHGILDLFNRAKNELTPKKMENAFLGNDSLSKESVINTLREMDQVFKTDLSDQLQTSNYQRAFKQLYNNPNKSFGSGSVLPEMAKSFAYGFGKGSVAGGAMGFPFGMSAPAGFAAGLAKGTYDASQVLSASKIKNPAEALEKNLLSQLSIDRSFANPVVNSAGQTFAGQQIAREITPAIDGSQAGAPSDPLAASMDQFDGGSDDVISAMDSFEDEGE